uniref:Exoribonuclease 1 n=1 Tax=Astyanax mexicanus TaxID=7994 RepID=A0A8B9GRV2_ASTMX
SSELRIRIRVSETGEKLGVKDVLNKRLKNYYKKQKLKQAAAGAPADTYYDYICVVDFEATCEENNPSDFVHEIIEFPVVLIDTHTLEMVDYFQEYVKPELNPQLSDFCVELTGITQEMVDEADTFPKVFRRVVSWLQKKELGTKYKYALLTDGSWDMSKFLYTQCRLSRIRYPQFARKWINIRKSYGNYYKVMFYVVCIKSFSLTDFLVIVQVSLIYKIAIQFKSLSSSLSSAARAPRDHIWPCSLWVGTVQ